ncbi:MAG: ATP-binding protein, partial [Myxococcota bacterium]
MSARGLPAADAVAERVVSLEEAHATVARPEGPRPDVVVLDAVSARAVQSLRAVAPDVVLLAWCVGPGAVREALAAGVDDVVRVLEDVPVRVEAVRARRAAAPPSDSLGDRVAALELIAHHAVESIYVMDGEGRAIFMNAAAERTFGWSREETLGRVLHDLIHAVRPDGSPFPMAECHLGRVFTLRKTLRDHEDQFLHKDGHFVPVACSNAPIVQDGEVIAAVLVAMDISARKREDEALRERARLESLGVLAGGIAHDFNNILAAMMGSATLLQRRVGDDPALQRRVAGILDAGRRGRDLTRQLLAYAGRADARVVPVDVNQLVRATVALVRELVPPGVTLATALDEGMPFVQADESQVQQVLMNLAINAAEAIGDRPGTVTLATRRVIVAEGDDRARWLGWTPVPGPHVEIEVADDGEGMDPDVRARIFEPFFTTKFHGRGLGLAATHGIVRSHRGILSVTSEKGRGTVVRASLPEAPGVDEVVEGPPVVLRGDGRVVLVVDDEPGVRDVARGMLQDWGFRVVATADAGEAIDLLGHGPLPAFALIDLNMPVLDGAEAARRMRARAGGLVVVGMSGSGMLEARERFGPDVPVLPKSFTADELAR